MLIRYEKWNDGHTMPTAWSGRGQPTEWQEVKPTRWSALIYWQPAGITNHTLRHFASKAERDQYVT